VGEPVILQLTNSFLSSPCWVKTTMLFQVARSLLCLALFLGLSGAASQVSPDQLLREAQQALTRGDYDRAIPIFQELVRADSKSPSLVLMLGVAQYQKGDFASAAASFRKSLRLRPKFPVADAFLGLSETQLGKTEQTPERLRRAFASNDPAIDSQLKRLLGMSLGKHYVESGSTLEAEQVYLTLMQNYPNDTEIVYQSFWLHLGRADQLMRVMLAEAPNSFRTHQMLGHLLAGKRLYPAAIERFRLALKENPSAPGLHYEIGNLFLAGGDSKSAATEYEKELRLNPQHAGSYYQLAEIAARNQEPDRAWELYQKTLQWDRTHVNAMVGLATALLSKDRPEEALPYCQSAVKIAPSNPRGHYLLSRVYRTLGRSTEAAAELAIFEKLQKEASSETANLLNLTAMGAQDLTITNGFDSEPPVKESK